MSKIKLLWSKLSRKELKQISNFSLSVARKIKLNNSLTNAVIELQPKISAETYSKLGNVMSPRKCVTSNNNKKIFLHSSAPLLDRTKPKPPSTAGSIPKTFPSLFTNKRRTHSFGIFIISITYENY